MKHTNNIKNTSSRSGISLLEVLTVVALIGVLLAIVVPAVQQARSSSRRTECANRLRQLGLAMHNFEASEREFPGGYEWRIQLLPYLDQKPLFEQFQSIFQAMKSGSTNLPAWRLNRQIPAFVCPSEPQSGSPVVSFYGNMGSGLQQFGFNGIIVPPPGGAFRYGAIDTLHTAGPVKTRDVTDGLSNTIAASEALAAVRLSVGAVRADEVSRYTLLSTFWQTTPSEITAHNFIDRVNNCGRAVERQASSSGGERGWDTWPVLWEDGSVGLGPIIYGWAYEHALTPNSPSCGNSYYGIYSASSMHGEVVNALVADGSVVPVSHSIDLNVWRSLGSRAGGENVAAF